MRILITAGSSVQAYKLKSVLPSSDEIFFGDDKPMPQVKLPGITFIKIPAARSENFSHELLALCLDKDITQVYPLNRNELSLFAESRTLFSEYGITVFVPAVDELPVYGFVSQGTPFIIHENNENNLIKINFPSRGIVVPSDGLLNLFIAS